MKKNQLSALILSASLLGATNPSFAQEATQHYAIPGGSLASTLNNFASKAGILLSADAQLTQGKQSSGLDGEYSNESALQKLLEGSNLTFERNGNNYLLKAKTASSTENLETIRVLGTPQSRYDSRALKTGSRFDKDVTEVGRSVDIIPEQLMLDTQARELEDIYKLAPNVVNSDGYGGTREDYLIRGFRRSADIYRNGVRLKTGRRFDPATVDNIQVLKGPVADIGQMMPGGLVNIVTKKPQLENENSLALSIDEHGQRRTVFDSTGAVADSEQFAYRVTASWEDSETFRDDSEVDRRFLSSSLSWFGDQGAFANFNYEYSKEKRSMDRGHITLVDGTNRIIADVPASQRFDNGMGINEVSSNLFEFDLKLPVTDAWDVEAKLFYNAEEADDSRFEVRTVIGDTLVRRLQGNEDRELDTLFARLQAVGEFDTATPIKLAAGVEYHQQDEEWINFVGGNQIGGTVTNPNSFALVDDSATASKDRRNVRTKSFGPFAQLDVQLNDQLTTTLGLRKEFYSANFKRVALSGGAATLAETERDSKVTKSAEVVWKATPETRAVRLLR